VKGHDAETVDRGAVVSKPMALFSEPETGDFRSPWSKLQTGRRKQMNTSTKDKIKGTVHEVKGKVKETAGKVTNNPNLQAEGNAEKNTGKVEKKVGQIEKVFEK
jgi:uncharacterized protein YjbJ (UPF0337 family)